MKISTRQSQVLAWMCQGMMNKEIAQQLGISEYTVRDHVSAMLKHYGCANRAALIALCVAKQVPTPTATSIAQRPPTDRRQATGDRRQATGDQISIARKPAPPTNVALHL